MLVTTAPILDGFQIKEYIGVVSGECALGTGFLSSLGAAFADLTGSRSGMYQSKLDEAKNSALRDMESKAAHLRANAIIGISIEYVAFTSDIMGVIALGTAVKLVKNGDKTAIDELGSELSYVHVIQKNLENKVLFKRMHYEPIKEGLYGIWFEAETKGLLFQAVKLNIQLSNAFGESHSVENIGIYNFTKHENRQNVLCSEESHVLIPYEIMDGLKEVQVEVLSLLTNGYILTAEESDKFDAKVTELEDSLMESGEEQLSENVVLISSQEAKKLLDDIGDFPSARLVKIYLDVFNNSHPDFFSEAFANKINDLVAKEEEGNFGMMAGTAIKLVKEYITPRSKK